MKKRILIVGKAAPCDAGVAEGLRRSYEVMCVADADSAFNVYSEFGPDLVVIHAGKGSVSALDFCKDVRAMPYGHLTLLVACLRGSDVDERLGFYEQGADDVLTSPVDGREMAARIGVCFKHREALTALAGSRAEMQIYSDELESRVRARTAEVIETRDVAVFALAKLAESRDPETGHHLERMREYTQIIAEELSRQGPYVAGIDKAFLDHLYRSSPLHDIGKVGIPDAVLLKPEQLTVTEFKIMAQHTVIGASALERASGYSKSGGFLQMAASIARSHHERFNGTGYPDSLSGEEIPLAARIVAVADVFDALTSARVYKDAFEPSVARSMIEGDAGSHFDPEVVSAFAARFDDLLAAGGLSATGEHDLAGASASIDARR